MDPGLAGPDRLLERARIGEAGDTAGGADLVGSLDVDGRAGVVLQRAAAENGAEGVEAEEDTSRPGQRERPLVFEGAAAVQAKHAGAAEGGGALQDGLARAGLQQGG